MFGIQTTLILRSAEQGRVSKDARSAEIDGRYGGNACLMLVALLLCACIAQAARITRRCADPSGSRSRCIRGIGAGRSGMTEVDFAIDQVSPTTVVGARLRHRAAPGEQEPARLRASQNYFYDRPRTCKRTADGRSFDCTRYTDMHIDNGLLCGVYEAPDQVYRPAWSRCRKGPRQRGAW